MQEEIENRTVTLIISAVKLTARELKAGMDKYLSEKKSKAILSRQVRTSETEVIPSQSTIAASRSSAGEKANPP